MTALANVSFAETINEMSRRKLENNIDFLESEDVASMNQSELERAIQEKDFELMRPEDLRQTNPKSR